MTQNNLGNAYRDRITGDRAENLETAIAAYQAALQVCTREAFPQNWATAQINLGNAYRNRITGDRAENLETAIAAYQAALQVCTRDGTSAQRASKPSSSPPTPWK
jgi:tetratricopeptide (TPR) repeat protein